MKYIGISGFMGAGKTTVANMIKNYLGNADILALAKPIKDIARGMGWNEEKDKKGRKLLQLIGTECGRECVHENVWVDKWFKETEMWEKEIALNIIDPIEYAICDDIRFDNEAKAFLNNKGFIILIRFHGQSSDHKSEQGISKANLSFDVDNSGTLEELEYQVQIICDIIKSIN